MRASFKLFTTSFINPQRTAMLAACALLLLCSLTHAQEGVTPLETDPLLTPTDPIPETEGDPLIPLQGDTIGETGFNPLLDKTPLRAVVDTAITNATDAAAESFKYNCAEPTQMQELAAQARQGQQPPRLQKVSIDCDLAICKSKEVIDKFQGLMDICVGTPYSKNILDATVIRLRKTGFFRHTCFETEPTQGGYNVRFRLTGATLVNSVNFTGIDLFTGPVLQSEVERRLQLRRGQHFYKTNPNAPTECTTSPSNNAHLQAITKRQSSIQDLYEERGYFKTRVSIKAKRLRSSPHLVDVTVNIDKGLPMKIGRIVVNKNPVLSYLDLRSILLQPINWLDLYNDRALSEGIRNVMKEFRRRGHYAARLTYKHTQKKTPKQQLADRRKRGEKLQNAKTPQNVEVDVFLEIDPGPRWEITFRGNKAFDESDLREQITFEQAGYIDKVEIQKTIDALRSFYETVGYYEATIKARLSERSNGTKYLTFNIFEGNRAEIRAVDIQNNTVIDDAELLNVLGTQPYGFLGLGGFLQRQQISDDLTKIIQKYQEKGYLNTKIPRWSLRTEDEGTALFVTIDVEENEPTLIEDLTINTPKNSVITREKIRQTIDDLRSEYKLTSRRTLSIPWLNASNVAITELYRAKGFPLTSVSISCKASNADDTAWGPCRAPAVPDECLPTSHSEHLSLCIPCADVKNAQCCSRVRNPSQCFPQGGIQSDNVDVRVDINTGKQIRVGEIFLRGNFKTLRSVIEDEIRVKKGDLFAIKTIFAGQTNLRSLSLFDSVTIDAIGYNDDIITRYSARNRASLVISVEESHSIFWNSAIGLEWRNILDNESVILLLLETALVERNLFGTAMQLQLGFKYAFMLEEAWDQVSDIDDSLWETITTWPRLERLLGTELIFRNPRFLSTLGIQRLDFTSTASYTEDLLGLENIDLDKVQFGLRNNLRKPFIDDHLISQIALEFKRTTTRRRDEDPRNREGARLFDPWRNTTLVSPRFTLDWRDNGLNPKQGWVADLAVDFALDFLESPTEFLRVTASWAQFFSFPKGYSPNRRLTFGYGVRVGRIIPLGGTEVIPDDERYRLGGVTSLRGFQDNAVGPQNFRFQALGGEMIGVGHVELRYPLIRGLGDGVADLFGAYFVDSGILADCFEDIDPKTRFQDPDSDLRFQPAQRLDSCLDDITMNNVRTSAGIGLRALLAGQIPVALDYGMLLNRRVGEEFGTLHLNVGYTFP